MQVKQKKPKAKLVGTDGNVFNTLGICAKALRTAGLTEESKEMTEKVFKARSYDEALHIMSEYCQFV